MDISMASDMDADMDADADAEKHGYRHECWQGHVHLHANDMKNIDRKGGSVLLPPSDRQIMHGWSNMSTTMTDHGSGCTSFSCCCSRQLPLSQLDI
jgi:hypothetical protein